jgi:hypothetical protein
MSGVAVAVCAVWITNVEGADLKGRLADMQAADPGSDYGWSLPQGTEAYSADALKRDGVVGIYKAPKGDRTGVLCADR